MSDHGEDVQLEDVEHEDEVDHAEENGVEEEVADGDGEEVADGEGEEVADGEDAEVADTEDVVMEEETEETVTEEAATEEADSKTEEKMEETKEEEKEGGKKEKEGEKKDKEKKKFGDRFFYPSANEYKEDLLQYFKTKGVAVGPVELTDLSNEKIFESLQNSERFCIRFLKESPDSDFCGHLMLYFDSEETAMKNKEELGQIRDGILVKHLKTVRNMRKGGNKGEGEKEAEEESKEAEETDKVSLEEIRKGSVPHKRSDLAKRTERTIVVTAIPAEITEEKIKEVIPNAENVYIPKSFVTGERKGYAYVELPSSEEVTKLDNSKVEFGEIECRLKKLDTLPSVGVVVNGINGEKKILSETGVFAKPDRERLLKLYRQGVHYERVDYLDDKQKENLKKAMESLRKRMAEDRQAHRRGGGRVGNAGGGGASGGGGGQGNKQSPRGAMKRPNQGRLSPGVANKRGRSRNYSDGGYGGGNYGGGNFGGGYGMGGGMGMGGMGMGMMGGGMGMGGMGMGGMGMGMGGMGNMGGMGMGMGGGGGGYNQRQGGRNRKSSRGGVGAAKRRAARGAKN